MRRRFLFVVCLLCLVWPFRHSLSGEGNSLYTPRQLEILDELLRFRPPEDADEGVWMLSVWDSDLGLSDIIPLPRGDSNAASRFYLLEDMYAAEKSSLDADGSDSRGVGALLDAAEMGMCRLSPDYYPVFDNAEAKQPDFQVVRAYLQALLRRAEKATARGDMREAERCYRAALVCGWHLTSDKSSSLVFVTGLIFKVRASQAFANFLVRSGDSARAERVRLYGERVAQLMRAFVWKANVALSEFDGFACLPAVIRIATGDAEPFWRKEAVVRLATLRYGVPDPSGTVVARHPLFEQAADEALAAMASGDPDPSVRRMVVWAANAVSPANYAAMEHRFP